MDVQPATRDAYRLVHEGSLALAEVESAGMRIDVHKLDNTINEVQQSMEQLEELLRQDELWKLWRRRYGKPELDSRQQLASVLLDAGYSLAKTDKGNRVTDKNELERIDSEFVRQWGKYQKLKKLKNTYLIGVRREVSGDFLRPSFNLHLVTTYRSSCSNPNSQNLPIRDPEIGRLIRECFIPRDGHVLVEIDYGALEFRVCACFWADPAMVAYASDKTLDIHRDMAAECYLLDEVSKQARFYAKNQFVFPTLYGSYYKNTAKNLWSSIENASLTTVDGLSLYDHLETKGIKNLGKCDYNEPAKRGTFEYHVKQVEESLCGRFSKWTERKQKWWQLYEKRGWFRLMTGFVCAGVFRKNNLYNTPIQGPAFHLLLWSLIQLVKWIKKERKKSRIIGQIHDSIIADVHLSELDEYLRKAKTVMTEDVRKHWRWVITPLEVEAEVARNNWFEKEAIEI